MAISLVGWAHSPFGRLDGQDLESLITSEVDGGFVPEIFSSPLVLQADDGLRWAPATRVENACASGAAALYGACDAIEAGRTKEALVVGAEKMTGVGGAEITRILGNASYVKEEAAQGLTFPGIFAQWTAAGQSVGRTQGQGTSDRRHRGAAARAGRHAAHGRAGEMQVPGAQLAGVFNMGGSALASCVSILEHTR